MRLLTTLLLSVVLFSCGKVETPEEFFSLTGDTGSSGTTGQSGVDGSNGEDGSNGIDGIDGSFEGELEYVTICPNVAPVQYMETLIYFNGQYLAYLSINQYKKQRLVILEEVPIYTTTDGRNVQYSIVNGELDCS